MAATIDYAQGLFTQALQKFKLAENNINNNRIKGIQVISICCKTVNMLNM